ncbi:Hypothetical_protein [Hexamita inflata]|uniref:Hypothetical_protein n=1 Tax=Hexamita inflata TaxID=28002 RepID=A0AA86V5V1_9EUKA|nr:Hypothetical protein HINF_LOCUS45288 [Hexamita inflata]
MCIQQNLISSSKFDQQGLIGYFAGRITILSSSVTYSLQASYIHAVGMVGFLTPQCSNSQITDAICTLNTILTDIYSVCAIGTIIGDEYAVNCTISNLIVYKSNISSVQKNGGVVGISVKSNLTITNTTVQNSNISSSLYIAGGFVGSLQNSSSTLITNSQIDSIMIFCPKFAGIILGNNENSTICITNSYSQGNNYINSIIIQLCSSLNDYTKPNGC